MKMMNTTLMKIHTVKMKKIIQNRHLGRLDFPGKSVISTCLCLYVYIFVHTCICICIRISSYRVKMRSILAISSWHIQSPNLPLIFFHPSPCGGFTFVFVAVFEFVFVEVFVFVFLSIMTWLYGTVATFLTSAKFHQQQWFWLYVCLGLARLAPMSLLN